VLRALPLADGRSLLHLSYGYGLNFAARLAARGYRGTQPPTGLRSVSEELPQPDVVEGSLRHIVERNGLRYYLALDAYLSGSKAR